MSNAANLGATATLQPAVPAGREFVPFCLHGTATSAGAGVVVSFLDADGATLKVPRAAKLIMMVTIKTTHGGNTTVSLAKNGTALTVSGGALNQAGTMTGAANFNIWNSSVASEYNWAAGDVLGASFSGATTDVLDTTFWFRPA